MSEDRLAWLRLSGRGQGDARVKDHQKGKACVEGVVKT